MDIPTSAIVGHGLVSLIGWLGGIAIGGSLGYILASAIRAVVSRFPASQETGILLPWRTILGGALILVCSPGAMIPLAVQFGLGEIAGTIAIGLAILLLTIPFTTAAFREHQHPSLLTIRLVAGARTLAIGAVVLTLFIGLFGGGGIGFIAIQSLRLLEYGTAFKGWLIVMGMALMLDVVLGGVQLAVSRKSKSIQ